MYQRLGDALFDQGRYPSAVDAYKLAIARSPLSPDAPMLQAQIVRAWARERRPDEEARARDVLLETYDESGAWWKKNQGSADLLRHVGDVRASNLVGAAAYRHARAQGLEKAGSAELEAVAGEERKKTADEQSADEHLKDAAVEERGLLERLLRCLLGRPRRALVLTRRLLRRRLRLVGPEAGRLASAHPREGIVDGTREKRDK